MPLSRRELLAGAVGAGAMIIGGRGLAFPLGGTTVPVDRLSRLGTGLRLAHADLHNHTLLSDGNGDPTKAFASMRSAGLDVAALTDHSGVQKHLPDSVCQGQSECQQVAGISEKSWAQLKEIADKAYEPGAFAAIRGFEWSSPTLGHMNVWFSADWTDPLHTGGLTTGEGAAQFAGQNLPGFAPLANPVDDAVRQLPTDGTTMALMYQWLASDPSTPALSGGSDGIAGFNHPGREPGRFDYFAYDARVSSRLVSMEIFNRNEDYLYEGTDEGFRSPLLDCLGKGWRVGLSGVTDEHGTNWGQPVGKGRTGLWLTDLTREAVRASMLSRRFFATRERGLRLDAEATGSGGVAAAMGSTLKHTTGDVQVRVDLATGVPGQRLLVQALSASGDLLPRVVHQQEITVPADTDPVLELTIPGVSAATAPWLVLRFTDPTRAADGRAVGPWKDAGHAVAYASPFYLG